MLCGPFGRLGLIGGVRVEVLGFLRRGNFKLKLSVLIVTAFFLSLTVSRLFLFNFHPEVFGTLTRAEVLNCFLNGLRFDWAMTCTFLMPLVFIFNFPYISKRFVKILLFCIAGMYMVLQCIMAADFIYFDTVKRHMAEELLVLGSDFGFIVRYAFTEELLTLLLIFGVYVLMLWLLNLLVNRYYTPKKIPTRRTMFILLLIFLIALFGIRGKLALHKGIGIGDVYSYVSSPEEANLTLNGLFTSFHTVRKGKVEFDNPTPIKEAVLNSRAALAGNKDKYVGWPFPLMRQLTTKEPIQKYNFFVVLLEGWSPYYIDSLAGGGKFKVTPHFDEIVKDAVVFSNAYSTGQRSIFGFSSAYLGLPMLPGLPMLGYGLELSRLPGIGAHFRQEGYYTVFAQASFRNSYRMGSLASGVIGMEEVFGREDMPELLEYKERASFGYDYDLLMFTGDKVKDKKNFLAFTFTAITHDPFTVTLPEFERYPRDSWEGGYLNALAYSDYAIGSLIQKAKDEGWFDNTIFIFLSDHSAGALGRQGLRNMYRIPFVIYAPKIFKPQKITRTVSQLDLLPTIYDIARLKKPYSALGKSVFDSSDTHFAFITDGITVGLIKNDGALLHNGSQIVKQEGEASFDAAKAAETVLSLEKAAAVLVKENRWFLED